MWTIIAVIMFISGGILITIMENKSKWLQNFVDTDFGMRVVIVRFAAFVISDIFLLYKFVLPLVLAALAS